MNSELILYQSYRTLLPKPFTVYSVLRECKKEETEDWDKM
jgi:hypothetical protein